MIEYGVTRCTWSNCDIPSIRHRKLKIRRTISQLVGLSFSLRMDY